MFLASPFARTVPMIYRPIIRNKAVEVKRGVVREEHSYFLPRELARPKFQQSFEFPPAEAANPRCRGLHLDPWRVENPQNTTTVFPEKSYFIRQMESRPNFFSYLPLPIPEACLILGGTVRVTLSEEGKLR